MDASPEDRKLIRDLAAAGKIRCADDPALRFAPDGPVRIRSVEFWGKNDYNEGGFIVNWSKPGCGFGQLTFYSRDGKICCDAETMGLDFCKETMLALIDSISLEG